MAEADGYSLRSLGRWMGAWCLTVLALPALGEGSWQFGLQEGPLHEQPLFEYNSSYENDDTGLQADLRPVFVDVLQAGEVINISLCGIADADAIRAEIWNASGTQQLGSFASGTGNISCDSDLSTAAAAPFQYTAPEAGIYQIRLFNDSNDGSAGVFRRFDLTVTDSLAAAVNPRRNRGRLWAYRWAFRCADGASCYDVDHATSSNLYAVVDGGFNDRFYVWQLDLNRFAGFAYELTANSTGLQSPNADGTVVAALSACIDTDDDPADGCGSVSGNRNNLSAEYPIYTSDPERDYPRPNTPPRVSNFRFLDDEGVDDSISPDETPLVQDTGNFLFDTNLITQGTYEIVIDSDQSGDFGRGDVYLNGIALPGANSVNWNGRDNQGLAIGDGAYNTRILLKTGEFHFTAADAETSGGSGANGLTINAVLDNGTIDTSNLVYWDDFSILALGSATAFNRDGAARFHNWGDFTATGEGNRAYLDTYVVGSASAPTVTRIDIEPNDDPKTTISGLVFEDIDGDGVRDTGEPGIANVQIQLTEQGSGDIIIVSTGSDGRYTAFTRDTAVAVAVVEDSVGAQYSRSSGTDGRVVNLAPGSVNDVGNDGFRGVLGSVAGSVAYDGDGDGDTADSDTGIGGVSINLFSDPNGDGNPDDGVNVDTTVTNTDGSFLFELVPEGFFVVVADDAPGMASTGESDSVADNQIALFREGLDAVSGLVFLDSDQPVALDVAVTPICVLDAPYIDYIITAVNFTPTSLATIEWLGSNGSVVQRLENQPLSGGRLLWPEASVDGSGRGNGWPGWELVAGEWREVASTLRPMATLRVSVNPTAMVNITYPPATPDCNAAPPGTQTGTGTSSGNIQPVPLLPVPLLWLLGGWVLVAGGVAANRRARVG